MQFLLWIIQIYIIICVVRVAMSWLNMNDSPGIIASIGQISYLLTEPVFALVRSKLPRFGDLPIDFSPMVVIISLGIIRSILAGLQ